METTRLSSLQMYAILDLNYYLLWNLFTYLFPVKYYKIAEQYRRFVIFRNFAFLIYAWF